MVSFALAWVMVTMVKETAREGGGEYEFQPGVFLFTGLVDIGIIFVICRFALEALTVVNGGG